MLLDTSTVIKDPSWGGYAIQVIGKGDDTTYQVLNGKGKHVKGVWLTMEGATACTELLVEGLLKE